MGTSPRARPRPSAAWGGDGFWQVTTARPLRTLTAGNGNPVVLFPGFALRPETYTGVAGELVRRGARVICFDLFSQRGPWRAEAVEEAAGEILLGLGEGPATMVAHSFGGGILLGLAAARPELARMLVFSDTLGLSRGLRLAEEALSARALVRLATRRAALSFFRSVATHPRVVAGAAWWGFRSDRSSEADTVAAGGIPCHVLWAERDTLLSRAEGQAFARRLHAGFHVMPGGPEGGPTDHDAMYRHPRLFSDALGRIGALG